MSAKSNRQSDSQAVEERLVLQRIETYLDNRDVGSLHARGGDCRGRSSASDDLRVYGADSLISSAGGR